jgi:DNA-binding LytR/AlgR family response regulator
MFMKINCIVIDDEPLARKGLREYIEDVDFLTFVGEFESPLKATDLLSRGSVQLIFLDIQMPKLSGLDFIKMMKGVPPVIFTTAYPEFALDGFELNALDYLVKPIAFERFLKATLKAKEYYEVRQKNLDSDTPASGTNVYFFIKADNKLVKIFFEDILFIEALQNYVTIRTKTKSYITYLTFKSVEEYLPDYFIKTHKSFIVSKTKVDSIEGNVIKIGNYEVAISRNLKDEVLMKLLGNSYLKR